MSIKTIETFNDSTERSLTSKQSGSLIFIDTGSADVTVNLPPPKAGVHYEFVISHTSTNSNNFTLKSVNSSYVHTSLMYAGRLGSTVGKTITVDSSAQTNLSDRIIVNSNGTNWFVSLLISTAANYSLTTDGA